MPFLNWVNKDQAMQAINAVDYRLLNFNAGYGDANPNNMLIQGDNLEALRALMPYYAGQVKCIYIDPPYNTQSAFAHYDDKLEHSQWLSMMTPRLMLLKDLLAQDGSIWVSIDDREAHYLKVLMDEIFGRENFVSNVIWEKKFSPQNDEKFITDAHDHIIVYTKDKKVSLFNRLERTEAHNDSFSNPDNDPRGVWSSGDMTSKTKAAGHSYPVETPSGVIHYPPKGRQWAPSLDTYQRWLNENRIWFGESGKNKPRIKQFLAELQDGIVPLSIWFRTNVSDNQDAKREAKAFNNDELFDTPKPERLLQRILHIATNPNDLVLDSFLGSGTTAAVAHKMGRRYIGIEMGEHSQTHCIPRLQKVIEGEQGGISKAVNWKGGGGFCAYTLGETVFDQHSCLNEAVGFAALAAHIWQSETEAGAGKVFDSPFLGGHNGIGYYLLYNGILGDRKPNGGNVLTRPLLSWLLESYPHDGQKVIYGEVSRLDEERLATLGIVFKQIPYKIKGV
jgi:adenine-specific DNA-methyltransferase